MPEPITPETPATIDLTVELETLRRVNAELLQKKEKHKLAIAAQEQSVAELTARLTAANDTIREIRVGEPVKALAAELSTVPGLFMETLAKTVKFDLDQNGKLAVFNLDGKPLVNAKGETVTATAESLRPFLIEGDSEHAKLMRAIVIGSRASGGIMPTNGQLNTSTAKPSLAQFGLGMK